MYISLAFNLILSLTIGFTTVYFITPFIIKIAQVKKMFDIPNARSATRQVVPTMGGISIFLGFIVSVIIASGKYNIDSLKYLFAAVLVMFSVGLYDDLLGTRALRKLIIEFFLAFFLVLLGNYQFTDLHGLFGFHQIGYVAGSILAIVSIVGIINAINLIDGIDGLASGTGIVITVAYGFWFLNSGDSIYAITCFSLTGSLFAFFLYNVFGTTNKIFMGDTGSLILGTIIAVLTIRFNEFVPVNAGIDEGLPAISLAIMILPVIDTTRVFVIRILRRKSPFSPDMNHIHHQLLRLGNSHLKSSLLIITFNCLIILLSYSLIPILGNTFLFLFILGLGFLLAGIPTEILKFSTRKRAKNPEIVSRGTLLVSNKKVS